MSQKSSSRRLVMIFESNAIIPMLHGPRSGLDRLVTIHKLFKMGDSFVHRPHYLGL